MPRGKVVSTAVALASNAGVLVDPSNTKGLKLSASVPITGTLRVTVGSKRVNVGDILSFTSSFLPRTELQDPDIEYGFRVHDMGDYNVAELIVP